VPAPGYTEIVNAFGRTGYVPTGLNTEADGSGDGYLFGQLIPATKCDNESLTLTLYVIWEEEKS